MCIIFSARFRVRERGVIEGQNLPYLVRLLSVLCLYVYNI